MSDSISNRLLSDISVKRLLSDSLPPDERLDSCLLEELETRLSSVERLATRDTSRDVAYERSRGVLTMLRGMGQPVDELIRHADAIPWQEAPDHLSTSMLGAELDVRCR